jgi:predicted transcriptional regulator
MPIVGLLVDYMTMTARGMAIERAESEMTREAQEVEPVAKYQRTITLTQDIADRLQAVCEHLGVTASAYIKQAIGESVSRHEVSLRPQQTAQNAETMMAKFFEAAASAMENQEVEQDGKKRPGAAKAK